MEQPTAVARIRTPTGDEAWQVTRYEQVKALLADPRLGRTHPKPAEAARVSESALLGGAAGGYETEDADHALMRARLVPRFSARRMRSMRPRVDAMVDELLDGMAASSSRPVDLHEALAFPLPVLVICELLGVPYADRGYFRKLTTGMADMTDNQLSADSFGSLIGYVKDLVGRKRAEPGNDMLSELLSIEDGSLSDDDIAGLGAIVLFAGHETTVVRIDMGTLLLLTNPDQYAALAADPGLATPAVEEILRLGSDRGGNGGQGGLLRYARTDLDVDGVRIAAGDAVLLAVRAANRDASAFDEPDRMDIRRSTDRPHLSFGHGARYCIGAALARLELTAVFERLCTRFPNLRLAVDVSELRWRSHLLTGGLAELPVTW